MFLAGIMNHNFLPMYSFALYFSPSALIMIGWIEHYLYRCCQINSECWYTRQSLYTQNRPTAHKSNQRRTQSCSIPRPLGPRSNVAIRLDWFHQASVSVRHASASPCVHFVCACLRERLHVQVLCLSACVMRNDKQSSFNSQRGRKFHKGFIYIYIYKAFA